MRKSNYFLSSQLLPFLCITIIVLYGMSARWAVTEHTVIDHPIRADAKDYFVYAKNLAESSIYSRDLNKNNGLKKDALRAPGFAFFASWFYEGDNIGSVNNLLWAQTSLQCLCLLLFSMVCWIFYGSWFSVIASLLVWTHPAFMSINTYYLTESLFLSSLILVLAVFLWVLKTEFSLISIIFLGLVLGFSALIRPIMEYYYLFLILLISFQFKGLLSKFWPALGIFLMLILAWKVRNYFAIGSFSEPRLMINALFHGSYPDFMYENRPESYGIPYRFEPLVDLYHQGVGQTLSLIWERVIQQPEVYLKWYLFGKQFTLWQWSIIAGQGDVFIYPMKISPIVYQTDLLFWHHFHRFLNGLFMVSGIFYAFFILIKGFFKATKFDLTYIIASLVVYASLFHILVAPYPRYAIPFKLFVIIMSLLFFRFILSKLFEWRKL